MNDFAARWTGLQNVGLTNHECVIVNTNSVEEVYSVSDDRQILLTLRNLLVQFFAQLDGHTGIVDPLRLDLRDIADLGNALPVEEYLVAQKSHAAITEREIAQDSRQVNRTLRRVSLHGGELDLDGRKKGVDGVPMEVCSTAAAASASAAWDPRKHAIHAGGSRSKLSWVGIDRVRARTGVGDADGMRACLAMSTGRLVQLRKASTVMIVRGHKTIYAVKMLTTLLTSTEVASYSILRNILERINSHR
eukprot:6213559-Pleurochrysis_carterae.AAC.1